MTATDELRRLLDEHGIEYCGGEIMTYTDDADYMPSASNTFDVTLYNITPEQAVEATLGSDLKAENDKLRELVTLNWEWAHSCCGNNCKMQTEECGYGIDRECNYEREIYDRMRELGIEVDA